MTIDKKTKIVATLGPATSTKEVLKGMLEEGANVFRINFSHADYDDVKQRIEMIRELNEEFGFTAAILADLQGPKLRVGVMKEEVVVNPGDEIIFATGERFEGTKERVYMTYERFPQDAKPGERILLDDGKLLFEVVSTDGKSEVKAKYDTKHLSEATHDKFLKKVNKMLKSSKSKGVIATRIIDDKQYISTTINSSANKKNVLSFPEPNPIAIWYNSANKHLEVAIKIKNQLLQIGTANTNDQYNLFCGYLEEVSIGAILLTSSLEAFMNLSIPFDCKVKIEEVMYSKDNLEMLDFKTKITKMIPLFSSLNFPKQHPIKYSYIMTCNDIRNDTIHLKTENNPNKSIYEKINKRLFDFPILEASNAVFDYINFHLPNFMIEES